MYKYLKAHDYPEKKKKIIIIVFVVVVVVVGVAKWTKIEQISQQRLFLL